MFTILKKIENLTVTIVGLGVIGAAFAQSFREIGIKRIYGIDIDEETLKKAEASEETTVILEKSKEKLDKAKLLEKNAEATQEEVDKSAEDLKETLEKLEKKLNEKVGDRNNQREENKFTLQLIAQQKKLKNKLKKLVFSY